MAAAHDTASMALFCDFENIALGVRDAQYDKFDIKPVLERLLAKGSIVVKKAYCDWERYKGFKAAMHEANFELIEIPHVRQSGKNSADIRMVVDALDLCYTKAHVDTFVIISGDSDFSPLVSKLRENAKKVIGVGVKQSCSDLLVTNCDEFIYYDDLVRDRETQRAVERRERDKRSPEEEAKRREKQEERKAKAIDIVAATFVDLIADRGDSERIWASVLKEVVKRRNPGFNESYYGFRSFGNLLEDAANRGLLGFGRDDKGAYVFRAPAKPPVVVDGDATPATSEVAVQTDDAVAVTENRENEPKSETPPAAEGESAGGGRRRGGRRSRGGRDRAAADNVPAGDASVTPTPAAATASAPASASDTPVVTEPATSSEPIPVADESKEAAPKARRGGRRSRPAGEKKADAPTDAAVPVTAPPLAEPVAAESSNAPAGDTPKKAPARKRAPARSRTKKTEGGSN